MKSDNIRLRGSASNGEDNVETDKLIENMENNNDNTTNSNDSINIKIENSTVDSSSSTTNTNEQNTTTSSTNTTPANTNTSIHPIAAALGMTSLGVSKYQNNMQ